MKKHQKHYYSHSSVINTKLHSKFLDLETVVWIRVLRGHGHMFSKKRGHVDVVEHMRYMGLRREVAVGRSGTISSQFSEMIATYCAPKKRKNNYAHN